MTDPVDLSELIDRWGDGTILMAAGLITGLLFGVVAQQSRFCLRSACIEFWRGKPAGQFAIWLLAFGAALLTTQLLITTDWLDIDTVRQLNGTGSLSGAMIGGLLFGIGMILARGCSSRLLVLSGTGNLRAMLTGLVLTIVAQASLRGVLSPLREQLASGWTISGSSRALLAGWPSASGLAIAVTILIIAAVFMRRQSAVRWWPALCGVGVGAAIGLGWALTAWHAGATFEPPSVQSITFTGPSADTLMALVNQPDILRRFGTGLVPGVFAGSLIAALLSREFAWQVFTADTGMWRYLTGAALMGFGSMLAGGCAVGAGVTGGSVFATTAWLALLCMWLGAGLTDWIMQARVGTPGTMRASA